MTRRVSTIVATLLALLGCDGGGAPAVEAIPPDEARRLYLDRCAICHGADGDGRGPRRGSLYAKPPDFREPTWRGTVTLESVRDSIREGRPGSDMPAWKTLSEAEIAGLAEHVLGIGAQDRLRAASGDESPGAPEPRE